MKYILAAILLAGAETPRAFTAAGYERALALSNYIILTSPVGEWKSGSSSTSRPSSISEPASRAAVRCSRRSTTRRGEFA